MKAPLRLTVKGVLDLALTSLLQGISDTRNNGFITISIIDNGVTLLSANEAFNKRLASSSNGDDWMDVGDLCQFDSIGSLNEVKKE